MQHSKPLRHRVSWSSARSAASNSTGRSSKRCCSGTQSLKGFALLPLLDAPLLADSLSELFALASQGELTVVHGGRYPLEETAQAHRALESRRTSGKVVLVP